MPASVEQLQRVPLFADLDRRELQALASSFKERRFSPGETVAAEGAGGIGFFVIDEGQAKVSVRGESRATLGPGDYFGEIALIDEGGRSASIVAATDLLCYGMTAWEFRPFVEEHPQVAWALLRTLARRFRDAEAHSH